MRISGYDGNRVIGVVRFFNNTQVNSIGAKDGSPKSDV